MNKFRKDLEAHSCGRRDAENELVALREALEGLSESQHSLKREFEERSNSLAGLGEVLRESLAIEQSLKVRIASDTAKIAELRDKLSAAEIAVAQTASEFPSEKQAAAAECEIDRLKDELEALKSEKAQLGGRAEKAERLLEQVRKEAATFAGEVHHLKNQIVTAEAALTASAEQLRSKLQSERALKEELEALRGEVLSLRARLSNNAHALEAERAKVRALAADLDSAQKYVGIEGWHRG